MTINADLQDLVDNPVESMSHELKDWLDINDNVVRANLARHIAALSNNGGGYILIGFNDKEEETTPEAVESNTYNRDSINGIVERYLIPTIHCDVTMIPSTATGTLHPVIRVPSHSKVPICSRAGGPNDDKGRPQGIRSGTYYIRSPGPKSEPISTPDAWSDLIHRCVVNERDSLLRDITTVLSRRSVANSAPSDPGLDWHLRSHKRFIEMLGKARNFDWPVDYGSNHYQLSYRIVRDSDHELQPGQLTNLLDTVNREIRGFVWTGWSMFYPFTREEIRPYFVQDELEGRDVNVLETSLIGRAVQATTCPDFWRFSGLGYASLIRAYREDQCIYQDRETKLRPGEWLSPFNLIRELSEFLRHAVLLSTFLENAQKVEFFGRWVGLEGRRIDEFDLGTDRHPRVARSDSRTFQGEWSIAELGANWKTVVAAVATHVLQLFDGLEVNEEWVRRHSREFRKI